MSNIEQTNVKTKNLASSQPEYYEIDSNQYCLDTDPDLQRDVEIDLPHNIASAGTRPSLSEKSRKTTLSKQTELNSENVVRSRGRQIKPHEIEPFLCIDNLPPEKTFVSDKLISKSNDHSRLSTHRAIAQSTSESPSIGLQLQQMSSFMSVLLHTSPVSPSPGIANGNISARQVKSLEPREPELGEEPSFSPDIKMELSAAFGINIKHAMLHTAHEFLRNAGSCTGQVTPTNTPFQSSHKRPPNLYLKLPFKQSNIKPDMVPDYRQTPSMGLKERTLLAAFHVQNMLSVAEEKQAHKVAGRLKKGKLKPLYPVKIEGPSIDKCRGILSETHSYQPSPSRTLQRRLHLMNTIPNVHEYLYGGRPTTGESLHRTSMASLTSLDENVNNNNIVRAKPNDMILNSEKTETMLEPVTPENTFVPIHFLEGLTGATAAAVSEKTARMFATEITGKDYDAINRNDEYPQHEFHMQHRLSIGESGETYSWHPIHGMLDSNEENPDGRCRSESLANAVRFVGGTTKKQNENYKEMKQLLNEDILKPHRNSIGSSGSSRKVTGGKNMPIDDVFDDLHEEIEVVAKRNKRNIKSSCKDDVLENNYMKENDDDSDQDRNIDSNGNNRNRKKTSVLSTSKQESRNSKTEKSKVKKSTNNENGQKRNVSLHVARPLSAEPARLKSYAKSWSRDSLRSCFEKNKSEVSNTSEMKQLVTLSQSGQSGHNQSSRFDKSKVNKAHTLQVSSLLHCDGVVVDFGPESPTRSWSDSASPNRCYQFGTGEVLSTDRMVHYFEKDSNYIENSKHFEQRSNVKFMLNGIEPEMEKISTNADDELDIISNQETMFDKLDSEIAMVPSVIQNSLLQVTNGNLHDQKCGEDLLIEANSLFEGQSVAEKMHERTSERTDGLDTIRERYYKLTEVYRKHWLERSETYGILITSLFLVTTWQTHYMVSARFQTQRLIIGQKKTWGTFVNVTYDDKKQKELSCDNMFHARLNTDSGCRSVDNLSTVTANYKNGSSIMSTTKDRNLLEIVCDQLSLMERETAAM